MFVAIMRATLDNRLAKYQGFPTEAGADAHVAMFADQYPDAFAAPEPSEPKEHWLLDMVAKTISIVPPPPPDFTAIDQATVDRLLLDSGVLRALARALLDHENRIRGLEGRSAITGEQFKTALKALIR